MTVKAKGNTVTLDRRSARRGISSYIAVFFWIGWTSFYLFLVLLSPFIYYYREKYMIQISVLIGIIVLSAVLPIHRKMQPKICMRLGEWVIDKVSDYFHMLVEHEDLDAVKKTGTAIFALEPHDVLPLSIFTFNDSLLTTPGHKCLGCVTSACFNLPLMRHVYTWVNAISVDKKTMLRLLSEGISPVLCPGGVQEVTLMKENEIVLYLKERKGFVKLAITHGVHLVPVFTFGLHKSFNYWVPKSKFMTNLARKIGFLPMLFFGVWSIPLGPAKPVDYSTIIGKPIPVGLISNPSDDEINKIHALYVQSISDIYHKYKDRFGMGHIRLRIA